MDAHSNFAYSTVATAPSPATSGTSLVVASGTGTLLPAVPFNAIIWPTGAQALSSNAEIVRVTAISTDTLTITRAQESTSARTVVVGDQFSAGITKKMITDIEAGLASAETQIALQVAKTEVGRIADLGYFCYSAAGLLLSVNASTVTTITTIVASSTFNENAHGLVAGDTITLTGLSNTTGVTNDTVYFVSATDLTANAFRVAATSGGAAITFGGTADTNTITATQVGKLNMAAGVSYRVTTELTAAAQTAIATTIASMADATNPKWVSVELSSSNVVTFNQGTAAASPGFPTINTARVPLGFIYIPANATQVNELLSTPDGLAKLIDVRRVHTFHPARLIATDVAATQLTNPTTIASILNGGTSISAIPANSLSVGDAFVIEGAVLYQNSQNASTITVQAFVNALGVGNFTSASLAANAVGRPLTMRVVVVVKDIGATGHIQYYARGSFGNVITTNSIEAETDSSMNGTAAGSVIDTTAAATIDLKVRVNTSSSTMVFWLGVFTVTKLPAQ